MKKTLYIALLICPFLLYNCGPDNPLKPTPEPDVLPPITTEGLNTAGCLVNGEVWLPKPGGAFKPAIDCEYYPRIEGSDPRSWGVLQLDLARYSNDHLDGDITVSHGWLFDTTTYTLYRNSNNPDRYGGGGDYLDVSSGGFKSYETTNNTTNFLRILKLDTVNQIISGTFQFDAINEEDITDTIKIREGRFDVKFTY